MEYKLLVFFILTFLNGLYALTLIPSTNPVPVGTNVTISLNELPDISFGAWLFGPSILFMWSSGVVITGSGYIDGIAFNRSSYALTLPFVNLRSSGLYVIEAMGTNSSRGQVYLNVQEPISNVTLNVSKSSLVEINDSVTFTCSASGTPMWVTWKNGNSNVTAGAGVAISNDGKVLTINAVTRYDQGPFMCVVANNISMQQSTQISLDINYGPSNLTLTVSPERVAYVSGMVIFLSCLTDSKPTASISWTYNGVPLNVNEPNLTLTNTTWNKTGQYSCIAYNAVTLRYAAVTKNIRIVDPISEVMVNPQAGYPVENMSYSLNCQIVGEMGSIQWMKNNMYLSSDNGITFSNQNLTLSFNQLSEYNNGQYQCVASNAVSTMTSVAYDLRVNYGPRNVAISGQDVTSVGSSVTFNCTADSQPQSQYSWYLNGHKVADRAVYITGALSGNSSGQYTCMAFNNITGKSSNASMELSVFVPVRAVTVNLANQQPIFNQSFTLSCTINGDVASIWWMKDGVHLYPNNRVIFSSDNLTLSFNQLTFEDAGQYKCAASNPVSNMTSLNYDLMVNYGPWNTTISGPAVAAAGSSVTFSCSADSYPTSQYSWFFSNTKVADGSVYVTGPLTTEERGQYTCKAFNNITKSINNASMDLTIINPISNVTVNRNNQQPVLDQSFTLNCTVSGDIASIQWMKNGVLLNPNDRTTFSSDNLRFSINQLTFDDGGQYQCAATNRVSNMTSLAYNLTVNYGPWNTTISGPAVAAVGSNVTFSCSANSYPASQYSWFFNHTKVADGSVYVTGPLRKSNSGQYTCISFNDITMSSNNASMELTVFNPISNVMVDTSIQQPVFDQSFTLNCTVSADVASIQWIKNGVRLYPNNRITYSNNNSTLSFNSLSLEDDGIYQCAASNPVGNMTSLAYNLAVNYGPWNTTISGPAVAAVGSSVTFSCSADSYPTSQYSWFFNDSEVADGSVYVMRALTLGDSGQYTCMAFNNITMISKNASVELTIFNPVSNVIVNTGNQLPVNNKVFNLTCTANDVASIQWMKNRVQLYPNNRITYSNNNSTLTFNPLTLEDDGEYQCIASNPVSNMYSLGYNVTVNYGPWRTTITGPSRAEMGSNVTFNCSASSRTQNEYSWFFNDSEVGSTSVYMIEGVSLNNTGEYTCLAFNNITGQTNIGKLVFTVYERISSVHVVSNQLIPQVSENLQLTCHVNGPYNSLHWLRNNETLQQSDRVTITSDNTTVKFTPLRTVDNGHYRCVATNIFRPHESDLYDLVASFGPLNVQILVTPGYMTTLICKAESQPPAVYQWLIDNVIVRNTSSLKVSLNSILNNNFTCVAKNPLTNMTVYTSHFINKPSTAVSVHVSMLTVLLTVLLLMLNECL